MDSNQGFITKRYILESLENNESNSELCELILELILEYPLQKYSKPMLLSNDKALEEIKNMAKMIRDIINNSKNMNRNNENNRYDQAGDIESGVAILLIHISAVFCRIMVEIFLNLSSDIEPHIDYWHKIGLKYQKQRGGSGSGSGGGNASSSSIMDKGSSSNGGSSGVSATGAAMNKGKQGESMKSIALRRARVFKKLKQDLMCQAGRLQWWYYGLANVEKVAENHEFDDIKPFVAEMRDLFQIDNGASGAQMEQQAQVQGADGAQMMGMADKTQEINIDNGMNSDMNNNNNNAPFYVRLLESLLETMIKSEAFVLKLEHDVEIWGMPPYWKQNLKLYALRATGVVIASAALYYNFPLIVNSVSKLFESLNIFMVEHTIEPLKVMYSELFESKKNQKEINVESLKQEVSSLASMIESFEMDYSTSNLNSTQIHKIKERAQNQDMSVLMDSYEKDIQNPMYSITKGSLLRNVLIQVQKMKVEVSTLMVQVDDLVDANRFNLELVALIPGILAMWGGITVAKDIILRKTRYYKQIESLGIPSYNLGAKPDLTELRRLFRQIHSLLVKNLSATYLGYEDCGIMLHLLYKLSKWGNTQTMDSKMSKEENEWLQLDIHHFISREFSIDQLLAQLRRMENYYLRL